MTGASSSQSPAAITGFAQAGGRSRVTTIDGLRGVAAMLVVLFHLHEAVSRTSIDWLWEPIEAVVRHGYLGVDVFFVISGFVIALSVSRGAPTPSYFARFVLRRSIRLDPPYWTAIAIELALLWLTLRVLPERASGIPSGATIAAHLFYLQELLGYGSIITIFWTLCYEVQFYGFYVGLSVLYAKLPRLLRRRALVVLVMTSLFILSIWTRFWAPSWLPDGLAINRWFQFFLGVLTWRTVSDRRWRPALWMAWALVVAAILAAGAPLAQLLAIAVSAIVLAGVRFDRIGSILRWRPLLFLGQISYSLYLFHTPFGWRFVSVVQLVIPGPWSPPLALLVYLIGVSLCVAVSAVLWKLVEQPLLMLSQRVALPRREIREATANSARLAA